jgi:hypothetical protein
MFTKTLIVAAAVVGVVAVVPIHQLSCASCTDQHGGDLAVRSPGSMSTTAIRTAPANGGTRPIVF